MIAVGRTLAGYRLDGELGRGATATVYAATELAEARRVAVKVLDPELRAQAAIRARFREAALLQRSLRHDHVLEVLEVVVAADHVFVATPLVDGTLADQLESGSLGIDRALALLHQVADALDFAHSAGVVHGDVKPRNVLVDDGDTALLADFGLAVAVSNVASAAAASPGTIGYSAPERLRGEPPTASADVYSLACVLFECLAGTPPFPHPTTQAVAGGHLFDAPPHASRRRPELPTAVDEPLVRGLAKDASERPHTARALVESTAAALEGLGPLAFTAPRPRPARREQPADDTLTDPIPVLPAPPAIETEDAPGLSARWYAAAAALLAACAVLGAWLGLRGAGEAGRTVGRGAVELRVPDGWRPLRPPRLSSMSLERPFAYAVPGSRATLVAGSVADGSRTAAEPELVRLAGGVGFRLTRPGLRLFLLPAPERWAVAACVGPALRRCEAAAGTLRLSSGEPYDAQPSRRFAAAYNAAMRVLRVARGSGLELLDKADSGRARARAATGIAVAYRTTSASILRTPPPPIARETTAELVRALDRAGVGYTRLAGASRRGNAPAQAAVGRLVLDAEAAIRRARLDLRALGYSR
jgi:tRNA A-37 threonylcarbamoyl transferase component Bud32